MKTQQALELLGTFTAEQWGMVTAQQAKTLDVDAVTLHRLERAGHLDQVRRGVYAATTAVVTEAREEQAAWLWLRPAEPAWNRAPLDQDDGVISHQSAARLHQLGDLVNDRITLITPRRRTSRDPGLQLITRKLAIDDVTEIDGLPVTTALRTICDLMDQHLDGSHVATIIRQAVEANLVQLDTLAEHLGPYALRYGVRRPGDGEALLEQLLVEIGTSTVELAHRPAPPRAENALALALAQQAVDIGKLSKHYHAEVDSLLRGLAMATRGQNLATAVFVNSLKLLLDTMPAKQAVAQLALDSGLIRQALVTHGDEILSASQGMDQEWLQAASDFVQQALAAGQPDTRDKASAAVDDDDGHGTGAPAHTPQLPGLPEGQGKEPGEGDRRGRR